MSQLPSDQRSSSRVNLPRAQVCSTTDGNVWHALLFTVQGVRFFRTFELTTPWLEKTQISGNHLKDGKFHCQINYVSYVTKKQNHWGRKHGIIEVDVKVKEQVGIHTKNVIILDSGHGIIGTKSARRVPTFSTCH